MIIKIVQASLVVVFVSLFAFAQSNTGKAQKEWNNLSLQIDTVKQDEHGKSTEGELQDSTTQVTNDTIEVNEKNESDANKDSPDEEEFINPFIVEEEGSIESPQSNDDRVRQADSGEALSQTSEGIDPLESEKPTVDILVDLAVGAGLPRFEVEPNTINASGIPNFLFNGGIMIPFAERFYIGASLRYLQFSFNLYEFDTVYIDINRTVYTEKEARESYTYLSVPIKAGMRFELGPVIPFFYIDFEPAYMMAGYQNSRKEVAATFPDSTSSNTVVTNDVGITDIRNQFQPFFGCGMGIEVSYGYGSVYLDASVQYNPFEINKNTSKEAGVNHTSCHALYFPITLGIRFFL